MLKKLSPTTMVSVPMSLVGGYVFYWMPHLLFANPGSYPFNHFSALLGAVALWLGLTGFINHYAGGLVGFNGTGTRAMGPKVIQWLLPAIAYLTGMITLMYGFLLGLSEAQHDERTTSFMLITSLAVLWFSADILLYRNQRIVRNGWIAIVNGKIYYPGERFRLKQLMRQDLDFVTDTISVSNDATILSNTFGALMLTINAKVELDFDSAMARDIRELSDDIAEAAGDELANQIDFAASSGSSLADLLRKPRPKSAFDAAGFPVTWDGKAIIEFDVIK